MRTVDTLRGAAPLGGGTRKLRQGAVAAVLAIVAVGSSAPFVIAKPGGDASTGGAEPPQPHAPKGHGPDGKHGEADKDRTKPRPPKVSSDLAQVAAEHPHRPVVAIAMFDGDTGPKAAVRAVRRAGGRVGARLPLIRGVAITMPARAAERFAARDKVRAVALNSRVKPQAAQVVSTANLATMFPSALRADETWNSFGLTGKGVGVAVIDTGIAGNLPDFRVTGRTASRVVESAVVNPGATSAGDAYGHGTHVAGIIAGNANNRERSDPGYGRYIGIAPEANLVSIKASDETGDTTLLDVIYGLQFAVDHRSDFNIRIVNLSLESTVAQSYRQDPLAAAVEATWFKGLVVVAAAGNRGASADAVQYAPGNDPYVISVGAIDDRGTKDKSDDIPAPWTSRGTTQDGFAKPDIYAPGARIVAPLAPASAFTTMCPTCIVDGQYIRAGGTSMSAPMVSGAVALILQAHPDLTPDQVKGLLAAFARKLPKGSFERDVGLVTPYDVVSALKADKAKYVSLYVANQGLTPSNLIDPATGDVDPTRASWRRASWRTADDALQAGWSRASWRCDCSTTPDGSVDPTRASWRLASWSTDWTK